MSLVLSLRDVGAGGRFGGKAVQLAALDRTPGVSVPEAFVVACDVFWQWVESTLPESQWPGRLIEGPERECRSDRLAAIRERLLAAPLPSNAQASIVDAYHRLGSPSVAVRSSALHEDSEGASAAGVHETVLGVQGETALVHAVRTCFASVYRERAMTYLRRVRPRERIGVAAIVQRMVDARCAGVMFTVDPVSHREGELIIEAGWGIGASVVDGTIAPDVLRAARVGPVLHRRVGEKRSEWRLVHGALERRDVEPDRANAPVLREEDVRALQAAATAVERAMGKARDIEWAFDGDALWLLQSRPIVGAREPENDRATWVWSRVNVGEALPGVATTLTWSIAREFSDLGFRRAFAGLGCDVPKDAELVSIFHGRIYLNLTSFMRIAAQVPALDPKMLLEFGGGGGLEALQSQIPRGSWARFALRAPRVGVRFLRENFGLSERLAAFERDFSAFRTKFESVDLANASRADLSKLLSDSEAVLDRTGALMLTCASGSLSSIVALRTLLRQLPGDVAPRLERELLTGLADVDSAAPGIALVHIAEQARAEPAARDVILRVHPKDLQLAELPPGGPTRRAFDAFLRAYGYRAAREAELSTPRWREAPQMLFAAVRAQLERSDLTALSRVDRQIAARAEAETELESRLPAITRAAARHLLSRTHRFVRLRERMRARVTEVLGYFRSIALAASGRIALRVTGAGVDAAFHLRLDELRAYLAGEMLDLAPLITGRRADMARDLARPEPPDTFVGSPPPLPPPDATGRNILEGVAASPGVVTGTVRVVQDPADGASLRPGDVLVVSVADVGWTPLFLVATAVITELGGALSHASLVAREYGVPAVVNVRGATRLLATGDKVQVDGDRGIVQVLSRARA